MLVENRSFAYTIGRNTVTSPPLMPVPHSAPKSLFQKIVHSNPHKLRDLMDVELRTLSAIHAVDEVLSSLGRRSSGAFPVKRTSSPVQVSDNQNPAPRSVASTSTQTHPPTALAKGVQVGADLCNRGCQTLEATHRNVGTQMEATEQENPSPPVKHTSATIDCGTQAVSEEPEDPRIELLERETRILAAELLSTALLYENLDKLSLTAQNAHLWNVLVLEEQDGRNAIRIEQLTDGNSIFIVAAIATRCMHVHMLKQQRASTQPSPHKSTLLLDDTASASEGLSELLEECNEALHGF